MNSDQRLTLFVALAGGLAVGAAIAGGLRRHRNPPRTRRDHAQHELDNWEGEGGNVPSVPTPVPMPVPAEALVSN